VYRRPFCKLVQLVAAATVCLGLAGLGAGGAGAAVAVPEGAAKPVPGSGIGTPAALNDPRCHAKSVDGRTLFDGYGRWNTTMVGGDGNGQLRGGICVKPWTAGDDNGGATSTGVTKDKITVVAVLPNDAQRAQTSSVSNLPALRSDPTKAAGTYQDAVHDWLLAYTQFFQTWGRDLDVKFVTSSGQDEAAQRADAVTIKAMKPFAVVDMVFTGLDTLDTELAKAKILVNGDSTTIAKALAQEPYRWGVSDSQAGALNSAEVIGKQLVGKKAEFGGSDVKSQTRKLGVVYIDNLFDIKQMEDVLKNYGGSGGKIATTASYTAPGSPLGDSTSAQAQAPTVVTKMKNAGVTTVVLLADSAMIRAMMTAATSQDWFPEWFATGATFQEAYAFTRSYPPDQAAHYFGISSLSPAYPGAREAANSTAQTDVQQWYWGTGVGTVTNMRTWYWLVQGIHSAGPNLTPKTFTQGWFSVPASGGAAENFKYGTMFAYGKNAGLPYNEYALAGLDYAPFWYDPTTTGPGNVAGIVGKGVEYYLDGSQRYQGGGWPKKPFTFFKTKGAVVFFDAPPDPVPVYIGDCTQCPSGGGPGQPGAPSDKELTIPATNGELAIKNDASG
jgi:hypothetical protein